MTVGTRAVRQVGGDARVGGVAFDWAMALLAAWPVAGAYLDGWAHLHIPQLETFFSPWHGVLYSGFVTVAVFTIAAALRNRAAGLAWPRLLPAGYEVTLLGVVIFGAAGLGDMVWHLAFGIENEFDALLSPTHLALALGMGLVVAGPFRSASRRGAQAARDIDVPRTRENGGRRGIAERLPAVVALGLLLALFAFMTQYAHPFGYPWPSAVLRPDADGSSFDLRVFAPQALGVLSVMLQTAILMSLVLVALRRGLLPAGSLTVILTVTTVMLYLMRQRIFEGLLPAPGLVLTGGAFVGGLVGDLQLWALRPSPERRAAFQVFAFAFPATLYAAYFIAILATVGTWWSIHLWTGTIAVAGLIGWLVSVLVLPHG